jgi:hypothetical protein
LQTSTVTSNGAPDGTLGGAASEATTRSGFQPMPITGPALSLFVSSSSAISPNASARAITFTGPERKKGAVASTTSSTQAPGASGATDTLPISGSSPNGIAESSASSEWKTLTIEGFACAVPRLQTRAVT